MPTVAEVWTVVTESPEPMIRKVDALTVLAYAYFIDRQDEFFHSHAVLLLHAQHM